MKIFISYRRSETQQEAQRIRLQLQLEFGIDSVFIDRAIPLGQEFDKFLESELKTCDALVAVMGRDFFRLKSKEGQEAERETDYVRWEIETALMMAVPIFPIIVKKQAMPREKDLPERLKAFSKRQALYAMEPAFETAIDQLVQTLRSSGIPLTKSEQQEIAALPTASSPSNPVAARPAPTTFFEYLSLRNLSVMMMVLPLAGWIISQLSGDFEIGVANVPKYLLLGLVYVTTTASITFSPLWFYKLVNVVRARLYLSVGSWRSIVVAGSATSIWITNAVFMSLATKEGFEYTFLGMHFPIWAYVLIGLLETLLLALLGAWEVAMNSKKGSNLGVTLIFGCHSLNCIIQLFLLYLILQYVSAGNSQAFHGLMLYLVACMCGTATFGVSWAWRDYFSANGIWSLVFLSSTLVASWVFLTLTSYAHAFVGLVL